LGFWVVKGALKVEDPREWRGSEEWFARGESDQPRRKVGPHSITGSAAEGLTKDEYR